MDYIYSSVLITILAVVSTPGKGDDFQTQGVPLEGDYVYHTFQDVNENQDYLTGDGPIEDHAYQTGTDVYSVDGTIQNRANPEGVIHDQNYYPTEGPIENHDNQPSDGIIEGYSYKTFNYAVKGHDYPATESTIGAKEFREYQMVEGNTEGYVHKPAEGIIVEYEWIPDVTPGLDYQVDVDPNQEFEYEMRKQGLIEDSDNQNGEDFIEGQTIQISDENFIPASLFAGIDTASDFTSMEPTTVSSLPIVDSDDQAGQDYIEGQTIQISVPVSDGSFIAIPASLFSGIDTANDFTNLGPTTLSTMATVADDFEDERIRDYRTRVRNYLKQLSEGNDQIIDVLKRPENTQTEEEMLTSDTMTSGKKESGKHGYASLNAKKSPKSAVGQIGNFIYSVGDNTRNIMLHMFETFISIFHQET